MAKTVQGKYPRRKDLFQSSGAPIEGDGEIKSPASPASSKGFAWYAEEAQRLIESYYLLRVDQEKLDAIANLSWNLPKPLKKVGKREAKTTAPSDAIKAGARVLTVLDEVVDVDPVTVSKKPDSKAATKKAAVWEDVLRWQLELATRRKSILKEDITRSALMYDEICGQLIHLPSQIKNVKAMGGNASRYEAALRNGQFAISLKNPQTVYTRYSEYGVEAVLHATVMSPRAIVDFWGKRAGPIAADVSAQKAEDWYVLFDYVDYDKRCVWAIPGDSVAAAAGEDETTLILFEDNELPFLPWICVTGGTNLSSAPEQQRFPLLWPTMKANLVDTVNIIGSIMLNEVIATASQPRLKKSGPDPSSIEIDYTNPTGEVDVPPGHDIDTLDQQPISPALRELYDRSLTDLQGGTIPRILVTAEAAPGEPFSGYNLRIQQAIASLMPFKRLSERWLEGMFRQMLFWAETSGEAIKGPKGYKINPSDIDPDHIYLSVELTPYEPLDEQQKINSAVMAARELKLPAEEIMGMMNITDPDKMLRKWAKEQISFAQLQGELKKIEMTASGEIQQMAQQMAQEMLQQQVQQAQQQAQAQQPSGPSPGQRSRPPLEGMEGVGGPGFNPAAGGRVPAEAFPAGNVRELQTGLTRGGGAP